MPSFDVVSSPDLQEIDNAINNTKREVDNRFDFKNTNSTIERSDYSITIETTDNTKLNQFNEILKNNMRPGDEIRVSTRRGSIKIRVREDRAIPEGVIFIPFCYNEAAANLLTNPALDPYGKIPEFKYCAAKIEKIN